LSYGQHALEGRRKTLTGGGIRGQQLHGSARDKARQSGKVHVLHRQVVLFPDYHQVSYRVDLPIYRQQVGGRVESQLGGTSGKGSKKCRSTLLPLGATGKRMEP
jgi:hypothetical protein